MLQAITVISLEQIQLVDQQKNKQQLFHNFFNPFLKLIFSGCSFSTGM